MKIFLRIPLSKIKKTKTTTVVLKNKIFDFLLFKNNI